MTTRSILTFILWDLRRKRERNRHKTYLKKSWLKTSLSDKGNRHPGPEITGSPKEDEPKETHVKTLCNQSVNN